METPEHGGGSGPSGGIGSELRSDARTIGDAAESRVLGAVDQRKGGAAQQVKSVATALDRAGGELQRSPDWIRTAFQSASEALQRLGDTVEQRDARDLSREIQRLARENPGTFLAGCALAGFAAARVLKAGVGQQAGPQMVGQQAGGEPA